MQLLSSWKEGIELFLPKNFKLFFLVTLASIATTYRVLLRYCWLPLTLFIFGFLAPMGTLPDWLAVILGYYEQITLSSIIWGSGLLFLVFFLAARPSVVPKTYRYFLSYWYYLVYSALFMWASSLLVDIITTTLGKGVVYAAYLFFIMIWSSFFFIFLLDSQGEPTPAVLTVWRSLKMFVYNVPLIIGMWLVASVLSFVITGPIMLLDYMIDLTIPAYAVMGSTLLDTIEMVLTIPIFACFMVNIYVKRLHDNFGSYFSMPKE